MIKLIILTNFVPRAISIRLILTRQERSFHNPKNQLMFQLIQNMIQLELESVTFMIMDFSFRTSPKRMLMTLNKQVYQ